VGSPDFSPHKARNRAYNVFDRQFAKHKRRTSRSQRWNEAHGLDRPEASIEALFALGFILIPPALSWAPHSAPRALLCVGLLLGAPSARAAWVAHRELRVAHTGAPPGPFGQYLRDRLRGAQPPMALPPAPKRSAVGVIDGV
jgi:hypothetical protein